MQKVLLMIYRNNDYISSQDVTGFNTEQIEENMKVKEEYGLNCRIKVFPSDYDVQAETGINVNDFRKGEV